MQALEEAPPDMQCKDKFILQSIVARPGSTTKDINSDMFNKDSGYEVKESKFRAVCIAPPPNYPPSPVQASGSSDQISVYLRSLLVRGPSKFQAKPNISELIAERDFLKELNKRHQQELERNDVIEKNKKLERKN